MNIETRACENLALSSSPRNSPSPRPLSKQRAPYIGSYSVDKCIGHGAFSKVYLSFDEESKQQIALKVIDKDMLRRNPRLDHQLTLEIEHMEKLSHDNIVRLLDVSYDEKHHKKSGVAVDVVVLALEYAPNGELFDILSRHGRFNEPLARTYFCQLLDAFEHCLSNGIAHRDIKPENILIDSNYSIKLTDFGFSKRVSIGHELLYTECGTNGYMAPEVLKKGRDEGGYCPSKSDIWSLGVVLFVMIAGFPPYQRPQSDDWWYNKLCRGKFELFWKAHRRNAIFSPQLEELLTGIFQVSPTERLSLSQLREHPWMDGPKLASEDLAQHVSSLL